jgi:CDP-4-dehydro-6-deoxyglucose reductase, E1
MQQKIKYPLAKDTIDRDDMYALSQWLLTVPSPQLTMGPLVKQYEDRWAKWLGREYSIFCNSGSSANLLMYAALQNSKKLRNNKVIVPSAAWPTTITPAIQLGFEPIMCESDIKNFGLNINYLRMLLDKHKASIVMLVQVLGVPADMEEILELKNLYDFILLEDSCAAMGSTYRGRKVGTFGDMASMSTYFGHQFSTIEGGLVSTDNKELYELMIMLRSHGWTKGLEPQSRAAILNKYGVEDIDTDFNFCLPGYNFRPTDLQAFIGMKQLKKMDWLVKRRNENHLLYTEQLADTFGFQIYDNTSTICSIHFCVLANSKEERTAIMKALKESGIETRPFTAGNQGLHPYWFTRYGKFTEPTTTTLFNCGFFLPNYPNLKTNDIQYISSVTIDAAQNFRQRREYK